MSQQGLPTLLVTAPTGPATGAGYLGYFGFKTTSSGYSGYMQVPALSAPQRTLSPMRLAAAGQSSRTHSPARLHSPHRTHSPQVSSHSPTRLHSPRRTHSPQPDSSLQRSPSHSPSPMRPRPVSGGGSAVLSASQPQQASPSPMRSRPSSGGSATAAAASPSPSPMKARPLSGGSSAGFSASGGGSAKVMTIPRMPQAPGFALLPCSPRTPSPGQICVKVDAKGDGCCNATGYDTTGDGLVDSLDTTGDGKIDTLVVKHSSGLAAAPPGKAAGTVSTPTPLAIGAVAGAKDKDVTIPNAPGKSCLSDAKPVRITEVEALAVYQRIDADGNGQISKLELLGAARRDRTLVDFLLQRSAKDVDMMSDEESFDAIDQLFEAIARSKKRINKAEFTTYFCKLTAKSTVSVELPDSTDETGRMFELIDLDGNGSITKFEMLSAIQLNPFVAAFMLRGVTSSSTLSEEEQFDAVEEVFAKISHSKKNADYAEFAAYFQKLSAAELERHKVNRSETRVLIIGPGFGAQLNPRQGQLVQEAGFQVRWVISVPNPEEPGFQMAPHLAQIKAEIAQFQPDVVASASKGDLYVIALWQAGFWQGPTLMINAHPNLKRLPQQMTVVIAHGSNDETYKRTRAELEELISSGSRNRCLLFYTSNSGLVGGGYSRLGDKHNMESLLSYDCLPRLLDAALSPAGPEMQMIWSWQGRLSQQRLQSEQRLGYTPEDLRRFWVSHDGAAGAGQCLFEVPRDSLEFRCVQEIYRGTPKEPAVYQNSNPAWQRAAIIKVERVENALQAEGSTIPYFESLRKSFESQDVPFEPGAHTRWAFHGTDAVESIINNPLQSFQPLTSGTRLGSLWGSGTYFARDSKYVVDSNFCSARPDGSHRMLMCLIMTGIPCLGDPTHTGVLPFRQEPHRYHSSVDSLSSPEIFVIQHPSAAHPAYVISFA